MTEWVALVNIKDEESKVAESIVFGEIKGKKRDFKTKVLNCTEGKAKWKTDCMDRAITVCNKFHPSKPVLSCYDNLWMKTCLLNGFYS